MKTSDAVVEQRIGVLIGRAFERDADVPVRRWVRRRDRAWPSAVIVIPVAWLLAAALALLGLAAVSTGLSRVPTAEVAVETAPAAPPWIEPGDPPLSDQ